MKPVRGFTLLEVLIAMSIFAVVGLIATQMLRTVIQTRDKTTDVVESMNDLSRALMVLERDLSQVVLRPVRDEYGEPLPALMVGSGNFPLEFTRSGWNNPMGLPRSSLQRVAYELDDEQLVRHFWLVLDRAEDSEPVTQKIITGVKDIRFQLLDEEGNTTNAWPDPDATTPLPAGIEIVIDTEKFGEIRRVHSLVAAARMSSATNRTGHGDSTGEAGDDETTEDNTAEDNAADDNNDNNDNSGDNNSGDSSGSNDGNSDTTEPGTNDDQGGSGK